MTSAQNEDTWGCIIVAVAVLGGGWWLYDRYEIKERQEAVAVPVTYPDYRPRGLVDVSTLASGTIWRLDADSLIGTRDARQFWIKADHSANGDVAARETQTLYRVDCETTAYRVLKVVDYDKDGKVLNTWGSEEFSKTDDYPPPDSVIGAAVRAGCSPAYDPPPSTSGPVPLQE